MAKLYGKGKGKSRSKRPEDATTPVWVKYSKEEAEALVLKLAKQGMQPAKIGSVLRDTYGIPLIRSITGESISKILAEHKLQSKVPVDITNLIKRAAKLKKHLKKNKQDKVSKRGLQLTEAKIRRLAKYYKGRDLLEEKWKYETEKL